LEQAAIQINQWVADYTDVLLSRALYRTNQLDLAEDLVQETFITAFKKHHQFKGNSSPKTWLTRILNNKIIDHYRSAARKKTEPFSKVALGFDENGSWLDRNMNALWEQKESLLDQPSFITALSHCMNNLPSQWKMVITAKFLEKKKSKEICQEYNITTSNYWQLVHRAKLQLKNCLENNYEIE